MFFKTKKSKTCVMLRQKITMGDKSLEQTSYYTENYVVSQILDKTTLYIAAENRQYMVDTAQKTLKPIDLSKQQMQINQLKATIGAFEIQEKNTDIDRQLSISNAEDNNIRLIAQVYIQTFPPLAKTCNPTYQSFNNSLQIYSLELAPDEYVARSHTEFIVNQQTQNTDIKSIEIKETPEKIPEFDAFLKYKKV